MIRRIILCIWALLPYCLYAQTDAKASEVLDKAFAIWKADSGIRAEFGGNENGVLLLKGEKFYLSNGTIESWYDGETQWSYVADTEAFVPLPPSCFFALHCTHLHSFPYMKFFSKPLDK